MRMLGVREAAAYIGVSINTAYKLIGTVIPAFNVGTKVKRHYRVSIEVLDKHLSGTLDPPPENRRENRSGIYHLDYKTWGTLSNETLQACLGAMVREDKGQIPLLREGLR